MENTPIVNELKARAKQLSVDIIKLYENLEKKEAAKIIGSEIIKSASLTAVNYSAACVATSRKEFYQSINATAKQADATVFWLNIFKDSDLASSDDVNPLLFEAQEILEVTSNLKKKQFIMNALQSVNLFSF